MDHGSVVVGSVMGRLQEGHTVGLERFDGKLKRSYMPSSSFGGGMTLPSASIAKFIQWY